MIKGDEDMKAYIKRVMNAVMNQPTQKVSLEKDYIIQTGEIRRFQKKVAVVTGASGAIGGAIAIRLACEGAKVYCGGRNRHKLDVLVNKIMELGGIALPLELDVTALESVQAASDVVLQNDRRVDILVNCAGGSTREKCANLWEQSIDMIDEMLITNLRGSMICTSILGRSMVANKYGKIVNIASVIGEHGKPRFSDYAASKAGIIGYTRSVAQEFGPMGVNVNCVSPGFIQRDYFTDQQLPYLLNSNFMKQIGTVQDIASAVAYLVSDEASFITGQNLCVDGGRSLGLHGD